jgi:hypothetical protein
VRFRLKGRRRAPLSTSVIAWITRESPTRAGQAQTPNALDSGITFFS